MWVTQVLKGASLKPPCRREVVQRGSDPLWTRSRFPSIGKSQSWSGHNHCSLLQTLDALLRSVTGGPLRTKRGKGRGDTRSERALQCSDATLGKAPPPLVNSLPSLQEMYVREYFSATEP